MVPLMCCRTHFTSSWWPFLGSCMYLIIIETACDKFSLVHTIAYIKLPIALAYGMRVMYSQSSTVVGDIVAFNLKWGASGVLTDFVSPSMLNLWSTFCKYPFCVKLTLPHLRSHWIYMPSTFFASPRSFISNSEDKSFFNLSIVNLLLEAISISSIYNSR